MCEILLINAEKEGGSRLWSIRVYFDFVYKELIGITLLCLRFYWVQVSVCNVTLID